MWVNVETEYLLGYEAYSREKYATQQHGDLPRREADRWPAPGRCGRAAQRGPHQPLPGGRRMTVGVLHNTTTESNKVVVSEVAFGVVSPPCTQLEIRLAEPVANVIDAREKCQSRFVMTFFCLGFRVAVLPNERPVQRFASVMVPPVGVNDCPMNCHPVIFSGYRYVPALSVALDVSGGSPTEPLFIAVLCEY